jgi:hypothetical protein
MQMYALDNYLGDDAENLTDDQKALLLRASDHIDAEYPEDGDLDEHGDDREAAFLAAVEYVMGDLSAEELLATQPVAAQAVGLRS